MVKIFISALEDCVIASRCYSFLQSHVQIDAIVKRRRGGPLLWKMQSVIALEYDIAMDIRGKEADKAKIILICRCIF